MLLQPLMSVNSGKIWHDDLDAHHIGRVNPPNANISFFTDRVSV